MIPASLCAYSARKRGRRPIIWFFLGITFGFLGLLALYLLPSKKASAPSPLSPSPKAPALLQKPEEPLQLWHYLDHSAKPQGPMSTEGLRNAWIHRTIVPSTYVWTDSMKNWEKIENLPDLEKQLSSP